MPIINHTIDFEPNSNAKFRWWMFTRKKTNKYGRLDLPGLFDTSDFPVDLFLTLLVIPFEIFGAYLLWQLVTSLNVFTVIILVLMDLLFASFKHWNKGKICIMKNEMILETDQNRINALDSKINGLNKWSYFWTFLLFSLAAFKVFIFYSFNQQSVDAFVIGIMFMYAVTGLIHYYSTGYCFSELFSWVRFYLQKREHLSSVLKKTVSESSITTFRKHFIHVDNSMVLVETNVGKHKLRLKNPTDVDNDPNNKYVLETWGVLTDSDIRNIVSAQSNISQKELVALECLHHQLFDILPSNAKR